MDEVGGFSSPNLLEAETNRAVRSRAKKVVVMADHTKWGEVAFSTFAQFEEADVLVTDSGLPPSALTILKSRVPDLRVVELQSQTTEAGR
jgi:DeoR/GlpR family transcriptional regulator of sugar metabolism